MITFLPHVDFKATMLCLDNARHGQQRREAAWMVNSLLQGKVHAVSAMWVGYTDALCYYGMICCETWAAKGKRDDMWTAFYLGLKIPFGEPAKMPPWLGSQKLHSSHRGRLLCKNIGFYNKFGWPEAPRETYFWPSSCSYDYTRMLGDQHDPLHKASPAFDFENHLVHYQGTRLRR